MIDVLFRKDWSSELLSELQLCQFWGFWVVVGSWVFRGADGLVSQWDRNKVRGYDTDDEASGLKI
jgi:hypothetical protein